MYRNTVFAPFRFIAPLWNTAGEQSGGSGGEAEADTGATTEQPDTALNGADTASEEKSEETSTTALDGGTAEGEDNSTGEGEGDDASDEDESEEGDSEVPETYEVTVDMPEGMELDTGLLEALTPEFKKLGLNNDQANELIGIYAEKQAEAMAAQVESVANVFKGWMDTAKADKEIGGENWERTLQRSNAVLREFGTPELIDELLVGQGVGNHPELIRFVDRIAAAISDDTFQTGKQTDTSEKADTAHTWYAATTPTSKKG